MMKDDVASRIPDGGWGWWCVLGAGITLFIAGGAPMTFSIVFQVVRDRFQVSVSQATGIYVVSVSMVLVAAPFVSVLTKRFKTRVVAVCGGVLATCGMLVASQASTIITVYIGYGFMGGLGISMTTIPAFVSLNAYFDKRRARAVALAGMADGVGGLVLPPLLTFMYAHYGFPGVMVAYAGVTAQCIVAGGLFRPIADGPKDEGSRQGPQDESREPEMPSENSISHEETEKYSSPTSCNGIILMQQDDDEDADTMETTLGTGYTENDRVTNGKGYSDSVASLMRHFLKIGELPYADEIESKKRVMVGDDSSIQDIYDDAALVDKIPSIIPNNDEAGNTIVRNSPGPPICDLNETTDISVSSYVFAETTEKTNCLQFIHHYFDLDLLRIPLFIFTALSVGAMSVAIGAGNLFLMPYARERGFLLNDIALLLSVRTGVFIFYKPLSGLVFDHHFIRKYRIELHAFICFGGGVCTLVAPFAQSQIPVYVTWVVSSFFFSWMVAQEPVVLADSVPRDKFTMAIGFGRCIRGICSLLGNILAGIIVDWSGSYNIAYYYGGTVLIIGSCTLQLACFLTRRQRHKHRLAEATPQTTDASQA